MIYFYFVIQLDSNKNNDYTFVHIAGNAGLNIHKKTKGVFVALRPENGGPHEIHDLHSLVPDHHEEDEDEEYHYHEPFYFLHDGRLYYGEPTIYHESSHDRPPLYLQEPSYSANYPLEEPSYNPPIYREQGPSHEVEPLYYNRAQIAEEYHEREVNSYQAHKEDHGPPAAYKLPVYMGPLYNALVKAALKVHGQGDLSLLQKQLNYNEKHNQKESEEELSYKAPTHEESRVHGMEDGDQYGIQDEGYYAYTNEASEIIPPGPYRIHLLNDGLQPSP